MNCRNLNIATCTVIVNLVYISIFGGIFSHTHKSYQFYKYR